MKLFAIIYTTIVVLATFSNVQAQGATGKNPDLPTFQFLLTSEPEPQRIQLCESNKGFCQTNCGGPEKAPMNFCNATTMGWGCGCSDKVPDLLGYLWPINYQNCIGTGEACKAACPDANKNNCNQACIAEYTQKCGTPEQPPAYYAVSDPSIVPTYAPPNNTTSPTNSTNSTNSTNNTNNSTHTNSSVSTENKQQSSASSIHHLGNAAAALIIIASGMSLL